MPLIQFWRSGEVTQCQNQPHYGAKHNQPKAFLHHVPKVSKIDAAREFRLRSQAAETANGWDNAVSGGRSDRRHRCNFRFVRHQEKVNRYWLMVISYLVIG